MSSYPISPKTTVAIFSKFNFFKCRKQLNLDPLVFGAGLEKSSMGVRS